MSARTKPAPVPRPGSRKGAPARGGHNRLPLDPGDRGHAAEDRDLTAQTFERPKPVEVGHRRKGLDLRVPVQVAGEDIPLGADPQRTPGPGAIAASVLR